MAKKVILKDLNDIEILPITRGELILDSSGKEAFHSNEFLATSSLPGLMSAEDKAKLTTVAANTIDTALSTTSENPVQNKVVTQAINKIKESYLKSATVSGNKLTITDLSDSKIEFNNTTYNIFSKETAANTGGSNGLVPKPSYNSGSSNRFLREDGNWMVPSIGQLSNSLSIKIKSGVTEGTDLYTYNGSADKILDIQQGENILLTPTLGVLTITASDSKVTQTNTTTDADYYLLFSESSDTATKTEGSRKSANIKYNPSKNTLTVGLALVSDVILNSSSLKTILDTLLSEINSVASKTSFDHLITEQLDSDVISSNYFYTDVFNSDTVTANSITTYLVTSPGTLTLNALGDGVYIKYKSDDTKSLVLNGTEFKPYDVANGLIDLGASDARWKRVYALTGDFSDVVLKGNSVSELLDILLSEIDSLSNKSSYKHLITELLDSDVISSVSVYADNLEADTVNATTVKASILQGYLDGSYINKLTGYAKATSISALSPTDTLNVALGKLEYKLGVAYDLVKGAYDGDGTIENLTEILKVLEGIKDTETIQGILGNYVTINTLQTIIADKIFSGMGAGILTVDRNSTNPAYVKFMKNGTLLGYLGISNDSIPIFTDKNATPYTIIHSGNYKNYVANMYWANIKVSSSSSTTTSPTFATATANTSVKTPLVGGADLTLNATSGSLRLKYADTDSKSVILNGTEFKPFDDANGNLDLGASDARWKTVYGGSGNFVGNVLSVVSDTTAISHKVQNSNGAVGIYAATNRGLYDFTNSAWIIYLTTDASKVYVSKWASRGSATQPVYFNSSGEPVACTAYSGLFTSFKTDSIKISATIGGVTKTVQAPTIMYLGDHAESASSSTAASALFDGTYFGASTGLYLTSIYQGTSYAPANFGNIINLAGRGGGLLLCSWNGSYNTGHLYYRSHRDVTTSGAWTPWVTILDSVNYKSVIGSSSFFKVNALTYNVTSSGTVDTGDIYLEMWRGTAASWKILNSSGVLKFLSNYTSDTGSYYDAFTITYNSGNIWAKGNAYIGGALFGSWGSERRFAAGGGDTYTWIDSRDSSGNVKNNIILHDSYTSTRTLAPHGNNTYSTGTSSLRWSNVYSVLGNFSGQITSSVATGTAPFVIASTTKVTNLNSDMLDGVHLMDKGGNSGVMRSWARGTYTAVNLYFGNGNVVVIDPIPTDDSSLWANTTIFSLGDLNIRNHQLAFGYGLDIIKYRRIYDSSSSLIYGSWRTLAFTDSNITGNAATATKLATVRTLWGLSFNGTDNVSGSLSNTGNITPSTTHTYTLGSSSLVYEKLYTRYIDTDSGYYLRLCSAGNEVVTVTTEKRVGILNTAPKYPLHVTGTTYTTKLVVVENLHNGDYGIDLQNSNIVGVNAIFTDDFAASGTEGYLFSRGDGYYDSIWAAKGVLYFSPNGNLNLNGSYSTNYTVLHSGNYSSYSTPYKSWTATITCALWSRLCYVLAASSITGSAYIINIRGTRNSVVYNNTYLVTAHHSSLGHAVLLGTSAYSSVSVRVCVDSTGNSYFELYDSANSATTSTSLYVYCKLITLACGTITTYTSSTSGATLASGFTAGTTLKSSASYKCSMQAVTFYATGNTYAAHFYENSDVRYKTIVNNLTIKANQLATIPLFDFKWKDNEDLLSTGTSAQAVQKLLPYIVNGDEKLTLDYGVLGTIAGITACKELTEQEREIEKLKLRVKELEDKLILFNL